MTINADVLYKGCLTASIAHAIMTNVYPELSYEQSWDGGNHSLQDTAGKRGTLSFSDGFCVGAVRDEGVPAIGQAELERILSEECPPSVGRLARQETLQYLLADDGGKVIPAVSGLFWADRSSLHCPQGHDERLKNALALFWRIVLPKDRAIEEWRAYYGMDDRAAALFCRLIDEKTAAGDRPITLRPEWQGLIPGGSVCRECAEAFREMDILL